MEVLKAKCPTQRRDIYDSYLHYILDFWLDLLNISSHHYPPFTFGHQQLLYCQ